MTRDPLTLTFVLIFPIMTMLIIGGSFGTTPDEAFPVNPSHWYFASYFTVVIGATWRHRDGTPLEDHELYRLPAFDVLANIAAHIPSRVDRRQIRPAATALARTALLIQQD